MATGENNIKPLKLIASDFNSLDNEQYHLSVEIGLENFSYALLNIDSLEYKTLYHYRIDSNLNIEKTIQNISDIYNKETLLKSPFSSISIAFTTFPNTLVPCETFIEGKELDMLKFNHEIFNSILKDKLKNIEAYNIYSVPKEILEMTNIFFPNIKIKSRSSILIDYLLKNNNSNQQIFLFLTNSNMEIIILNNGKLLLQNIFRYSTKEDVLYYLLSSMRELELSPEECPVTLFGEIRKNDTTFNLLYEYIRNISFAERSDKFKYPAEFQKLDKHQFLPLLTQILCV